MTSNRIFVSLVLGLLTACRGSESGEQADHPVEHRDHASTGEHAGNDEHAGHTAVAAEAPVLDTSLFQLESRFSDVSGSAFPLSQLRGEPTLVIMFYGTCTTVCPILVDDGRAALEALPAVERDQVKLLLVTFDPERDTAERLTAFANDHHLDLARTVMLRGASDGDIRELAAALGVQYRKLPDGNFSHSALMTLLDSEGRIVERIEGLRQPNAPIVARVHTLLAPTL